MNNRFFVLLLSSVFFLTSLKTVGKVSEEVLSDDQMSNNIVQEKFPNATVTKQNTSTEALSILTSPKGAEFHLEKVIGNTAYLINSSGGQKAYEGLEAFPIYQDAICKDITSSSNSISNLQKASDNELNRARANLYLTPNSPLTDKNCFSKKTSDLKKSSSNNIIATNEPDTKYRDIINIVSNKNYLQCLEQNFCDKKINLQACSRVLDLKNPLQMKNIVLSCAKDLLSDNKNKLIVPVKFSTTIQSVSSIILIFNSSNLNSNKSALENQKMISKCIDSLPFELRESVIKETDWTLPHDIAKADAKLHEENSASQKVVNIPLNNLQRAHVNSAIQGYINQYSSPSLGSTYTVPSPTAVRKISNMFDRAITKADAAVKSGAAKTPQQIASVFDQEIQKDEILFQKNDRVVINGSSKLSKVEVPDSKNTDSAAGTDVAKNAQGKASNSVGGIVGKAVAQDTPSGVSSSSGTAERSPSSLESTSGFNEEQVLRSLASSAGKVKSDLGLQRMYSQKLEKLGLQVVIQNVVLGAKRPRAKYNYDAKTGRFLLK